MSTNKTGFYNLSPQQKLEYYTFKKNNKFSTGKVTIDLQRDFLDVFLNSISKIINEDILFKLEVYLDSSFNFPLQRLNEESSFTICRNKQIEEEDFSNNDKIIFISILEKDQDTFEVTIQSLLLYVDLWSLLLLVDKSMRLANGENIEPDTINYLQFSEWKNQLLQSEDSSEFKNYWKSKIDYSPLIDVNFESKYENKKTNVFSAKLESKLIDNQNISNLTNEKHLLASWYYTLNLISKSEEDFGTIGYVSNGRSFEQLYNNFGSFSFCIPFYLNNNKKIKLADELLSNVDIELNNINSNKDYIEITEEYCDYCSKDLSYFFEYIDFSLFNKFKGLSINEFNSESESVKLKLQILNTSDDIFINILYDTSLYNVNDIEYIYNLWKKLYENILNDPKNFILEDFKIKSIKSHIPQASVIKESVLDVFNFQVNENPDKIAIVDSFRSISYNELDHYSNVIARHILKQNLDKIFNIGILCESNNDLVISMLAVLKSGLSYVPLDPNDTHYRLNHIINDSGIKYILCHKKYSAILEDNENVIPIYVDEIDIGEEKNSEISFNERQPDNVSYIIYTSGTTGVPKGVCIKDKSLVNYVNWLNRDLEINKNDSSILLSSYAFDLGYTAIWGIILSGGTLHLVDREKIYHPDIILDYVVKHKISYLKTTPSYFSILCNSYNHSEIEKSGLRLIFLGGENINVNDVIKVRDINSKIKFVNHYGPTETTIGCIAHKIEKEQLLEYKARPLIGKPIDNNFAVILDENRREVKAGIVGEIFIGGMGLAEGYFNQEELTQEKFILHQDFGRIYKTGDLGIQYLDNTIQYLGRSDNQVKIRGYRVELEEIKRVVEDKTIVNKAVIVTGKNNSENEIIAFVTSNYKIEINNLKAEMAGLLPEYMIPSKIIQIDKIPLTSNNKIDTKKLLSLSASKNTVNNQSFANSLIEQKIIDYWKEIFQRDQINKSDNFFDLGGHSLKGIQFLNWVQKEFNIRMGLKEIYDFPTPNEFSTLLESEEITEQNNDIKLIELQENYEVSNSQRRFWLTSQRREAAHLYIVPVIQKIKGEINIDVLKATFMKIIERHEVLRTTYSFRGSLRQSVITMDEVYFPFEILENDENIQTLINEELQTPFNLDKEISIRVKIIKNATDEYTLLLTLHHIACDGWSRGVLSKELQIIYNSLISDKDISLPNLKIQYKDYVYWHNKVCIEQEPFWSNFFSKEIPVLNFPTDFPRDKKMTFKGNKVSKGLSGEEFENLKKQLKLNGVSFNTFILSIYGLLIHSYSGQDELVIGTITSGRTHSDIEPLIGTFINYIPINIQVDKNESIHGYINAINANIINAYDNQDYPFDMMLEKFYKQQNTFRNPVFDTMIIFHDDENASNETVLADGVKIFDAEGDEDRGVAKLDFKIDAAVLDDKLEMSLEYNASLFKNETMSDFLDQFISLIQLASRNYENKIDNLLSENILSLSKETTNTNKKTLRFISSFVAEPINESLKYCFDKFSIDYNLKHENYNQVFQSLSTISEQSKYDFLFIFSRFEDYLNKDKTFSENVEQLKIIKKSLIESIKNSSKHLVKVVGVFPVDERLGDIATVIRQLNDELATDLIKMDNVYLIDFLRINKTFPNSPIFDDYRQSMAAIPFKENFFYGMSFEICRFLLAFNTNIPLKVIAVDCDNTLWKGICNESEVIDLKISRGYQYFQNFLVSKYNEGFVIVLLSKNNEEDVLRVFDNHPDMILKKEHVLSYRINWEDKYSNLIDIAKELNVGINSFAFIDDNPWECQQMMINLPEVTTLQLPENDDEFINYINRVICFDKVNVVVEDYERNKMYKEEISRKNLSKNVSLDKFLNDLELKVSFNPVKENEIDRVVQLITRTNQFVLNGKKIKKEDFQSASKKQCYVIYVNDKFGNYGLTGVVILSENEKSLIVETLNLSCRILGKKIENSIFYCIKKKALELNLDTILLKYEATEKNLLLQKFIESNEYIDSNSSETNLNLSIIEEKHIELFYEIDFPVEKNEVNRFNFHHIGIAVNKIEDSISFYMDLGFEFDEIVFDPIQDCRLLIGEHPKHGRIELVQGVTKSIIDNIDETGTPYHICLIVENLEDTLVYLNDINFGYDIVKRPEPAILFQNKRVMFIYNKNVGLIEFLEDSVNELQSKKNILPIKLFSPSIEECFRDLEKIGHIQNPLTTPTNLNEGQTFSVEVLKSIENISPYMVLNFNETIDSNKSATENEVKKWDWIDYIVNNENIQRKEVYVAFEISNSDSCVNLVNSNNLEDDSDLEIKQILLNLYEFILGKEIVNEEDSFFEMGGNSLMATQVLSRLYYNHGIEINLVDFFDNSSIKKLSIIIEEKENINFKNEIII